MRAFVNKIDEEGYTRMYEADIESYKDYYTHLGCSCFDVVMIEYEGHKLSVYCDDEGMMKPNFGRIIGTYPQPIFGNVVITGDVDENGETLGVPKELGILDMYEIIGDVKWAIGC